MRSRRILTTGLVVWLCASRVPADVEDILRKEFAIILSLIDDARYPEASRRTVAALGLLRTWHIDYKALPLLAYLPKAELEQGRPLDSRRLLELAEGLRAKLPGSGYDIALLRERAELHYAEADFDRAAEVAEQAYQRVVTARGSIHRAEYCRSLQAMALLRLGQNTEALKLAIKVAQTLHSGQSNSRGFTPRIHQHLCIVFAHTGGDSRKVEAEGHCRKGLALAARKDKRETRDLVLGHLAYSEYFLRAGERARARESAEQAITISRKLFGSLHQDLASASTLLAAVDLQEGSTESAGRRIADAARIADGLFGADSVSATRLRRQFSATPRLQHQ